MRKVMTAAALCVFTASQGTPASEQMPGAVAGSAVQEPQRQPAPMLNVVPEIAIHQTVETFVRGRLRDDEVAMRASRVEIHTRWQGDIVLDLVGDVELKVRPVSPRAFRGPTVIRVEVLVDGETERTITATVDTRLYERVAVTARAVRRGSLFSETAIELAERDVTNLRHGYFRDLTELASLQAVRPIGFGAVVTRRHAEAVPFVRRGDDVVIVLVSRNMHMSAVGVALQDGVIGARIRVKNIDSGKIVFGIVEEDGSIAIKNS